MADASAPKKASGVNSGIRIVLALLIAIAIGIFMLAWDAKFLEHDALPDWLGPYVFTPLIATILGYGSNCLVQQLSCGQVQWMLQLSRIAMVPIPIILMWFILHIAPVLRWPIEGLIQSGTPELQRGLSSGYFAFWVGLYCQNSMNGAAQLCPV